MTTIAPEVRKLERQDVQIRRVGDGLFEIARTRVGGELQFVSFDIAEIPETALPALPRDF